jgi:large subunit ribosomal protein L25
MDFTIEGKLRPADSKPNALRREGLMPASLYGHDGNKSVSIVINAKDALTMIRRAAPRAKVTLNVPEAKWSGTAVLQEVQKHPWRSDSIYHISFMAAKELSGK